MANKTVPNKPVLILLYGSPGAGKTYFARQFCENVQIAHLQCDRLRCELFQKPRYDKQETDIVMQLMNFMSEEFLNAGVSVVYDANTLRAIQRHNLREIARKVRAYPLVVWFQTDADTAYLRNTKRDHRRADDKYAASYDRENFRAIVNHMQNPTNAEDYVVVSGKHAFKMQYGAVTRRLRELELVGIDDAPQAVKPGLVNLVPQPNARKGRVDITRRNVFIRS